ncbi:TonB-dependent receptor [Algimonas porphyrae]|uniref:TonB-dependent receptor n=2 Tax=Algimonas porphyrae TaxID=1128113 RepID=A0ABQ5V4T4_9PROT|nr:TonB-dependent receptor [Algimonas porphyrae]GLQ22092.1 TonB-dependent receptor [Algimonas porphyrae]
MPNIQHTIMLSSALALLMSQEAAWAQNNDEIIVTARKQAENILEVPLAVTAISAADIDAANLENIVDLAAFTPGFQLESFNSIPGRYDSTPFIRGVVFDSTDPLRQTVSVFVDGVFVSGGNMMLDFEGIERVEVIKGPQSAQFGRSTFAGAVNYITADPSTEFQGRLSGLAATRDEYEITASVEGPILGDTLSGRLTGRYNFNGGHYDNALDPSQELGEEETLSFGAMLMYQPSDNFKTRLRGFYSEIDDGQPATILLDSSFNSGPFVPGGETIFAGTIPEFDAADIGLNSTDADFDAFIADAATRDVFFSITPDRFGLDREALRISLDGQYDFDNGIALNYVAGYSSEKATSLIDVDSSPDATYTQVANREFEDLQGEIRLSGNAFDESVFWSFGANYYELKFDTGGAFGLQAFGQSFSFGQDGFLDREDVNTLGFFGKVDWDVTDRFSLSFEGRYQEDEIDEGPDANGTFTSFLPRVTADYEPWEDGLFYATYSEGNLPGGFNSNFFDLTADQVTALQTQFAGLDSTYDEETLKNYEIGWKQNFDDLMNLQFSFYKMERVDQVTRAVAQLPNPAFVGDPTQPPIVTETFFVNAAATDIYGAELETNWYPTDNLSLRATLAWTNAEISNFPASGDSGDFEDVFLTDDGFIGQKAERYPPIQITLSGTYDKPIGSLGNMEANWYLRGDILYANEYFISTPNLGESPAVTDARLRTGIRTDRYTLEAFVTNLFEETAPTAANNYIDLSNTTPLFSFGVEAVQVGLRDKRQFGIRAAMNF